MKKKIIAAALICSVMISVFAVPSSAVLTETVIAGGLIAAYMAAVGITVAVDNRSDVELGQWLYDRFQNWCEKTGQIIDATNVLAAVAVANGQVKINNAMSNILSRFMPDLVAVNIHEGISQINGINFPLKVYSDQTTNYIYEPNWNLNQTITVTLNNGQVDSGYFYIDSRNVLQFSGFQRWNGTRRIRLASQYTGNKPAQDNRVQLFLLNVDSTTYLAATNVNSGYYKNPAQSWATTLCQIGLGGFLDYNVSSISTGEITVPLPSESLSDDEETVIDIGIPVTSVSDAAEKSLATTIDGTISATYTNTNPIPPVPETNLSWVHSLHSIWEYVEYLIDQASAGFTFFSGLLAALPVEVEFCFYGALVLLLFGGVISRLLL